MTLTRRALLLPSGMIKKAIVEAAAYLPGRYSKMQVGMFLYVPEPMVFLYGIPKMIMQNVRNSDAKRTRDIHTHAILPRWAATVTLRFVSNYLTGEKMSA